MEIYISNLLQAISQIKNKHICSNWEENKRIRALKCIVLKELHSI